METGTAFYYAVLSNTVISKVSDVFTTKLFTEFQLERTLFNFICPAEKTVFNANYIQNEIMCTMLCAKERSCIGVFFQPTTKDCVGCISTYGLLPLDGALFYRKVYSNIAKGKSTNTTRSSKHSPLAVDGRTRVCLSLYEEEWWLLDLGAFYDVTSVNIIFHKKERNGTFSLEVGTSISSFSVVPEETSYMRHDKDLHLSIRSYNFSSDLLKARYVRIRSECGCKLGLCEVEVYGTPACN